MPASLLCTLRNVKFADFEYPRVMEHWQKILVGVLGIATFVAIFYFLIFDRLLKSFRSTSPSVSDKSSSTAVPVFRFAANRRSHRGQPLSRQEVERLVYEEYRTEGHEVLAVTANDDRVCVGICAFLNELKVEYFLERFPRCCVKRCDDLALRGAAAVTGHWCEKWTAAEKVNLLCQEREMVLRANTEGSREKRVFVQFEDKYAFKVGVQWNENFVCHDVDFQELWEELVVLAKHLLKEQEGEESSAWNDFPLEHWDRTRVRLDSAKFHLVPHLGQVANSSDSSSEGEIDNSEQLPLIQI